MNQKHLLKISALFFAALAWSNPAIAEEHAHVHGENCNHQHEHKHAEEKQAAEQHVHSESCTHNHTEHSHEHAHAEHAHAHAGSCNHEHEHKHAEEKQVAEQHVHSESCTHNHAEHNHEHAESYNHQHEHKHAEEKQESEQHVHSENCSHNHAEHSHEHAHAEHTHAHGESCNHDHAQASTEHNHEHAHGESCCSDHDLGTPVKISDRARQSIAMRFEKVADRPISETRSYYGQMIVPAEALKTGALSAAGRVRFHVKPGQEVAAGTPLFSLASPELITLESDCAEAEANLSRARANLSTLEKRLARLAQIGNKNSNLETEAAFLKAEIPVLAAAAKRARGLWQIATLGGSFRNGVLTVYSSFSGRIQSLDLSEGAWGEQGAGALTLVVPQTLEFKGIAFGNDSFVGKKARLAVNIGDETHYYDGALRISAQIDEATQARTIYFVPEKADADIYPGQIARLEVFTPATEAEAAFVPVPSSAVVKVGVDDIVFVCATADPNVFFARKVKTLPARRGMTPVKGVRVGETIVSKGGYELKYVLPVDGNAPQRKTAGHFHADGKFHEGEH